VQGLPDRTVKNMVKFMDRLRGMHAQDALAFEVCVRHVASIIEDQRREEGHADPGTTAPPDLQLRPPGAVSLVGDRAVGQCDRRIRAWSDSRMAS
jgi:hypothetical protein